VQRVNRRDDAPKCRAASPMECASFDARFDYTDAVRTTRVSKMWHGRRSQRRTACWGPWRITPMPRDAGGWPRQAGPLSPTDRDAAGASKFFLGI